MTNPSTEEWRPVLGYEGLYEVSDQGRVRSLPRQRTPGKVLRQNPSGRGYLRVTLWSGSRKDFSVHRLVAIAFIANPASRPEVNHVNGAKTDNRRVNLEWATRSANVRHSFRELGRKPSRAMLGKASPRRKLSEQQIAEIRADGRTQREIAAEYAVSQGTVSNVKLCKMYKGARQKCV